MKRSPPPAHVISSDKVEGKNDSQSPGEMMVGGGT